MHLNWIERLRHERRCRFIDDANHAAKARVILHPTSQLMDLRNEFTPRIHVAGEVPSILTSYITDAPLAHMNGNGMRIIRIVRLSN